MLTRIILLASLSLAWLTSPVWAQQAPKRSFIRDAEVENTIRAFATPLFQIAGLDPDAVGIHIVVDPSLNAYVAGGQHLFMHTGLLVRSDNAGQVIGVIAHETGHIAGGHLSRLSDAVGNAGNEALVAMLLGAAVGVASKRPDVGAAVALGGQEAVIRNFLTHTRGEESSADQAAVKYLDATQQSAKGMEEFFDILGDQELLVSSRQDPYVRTHPLTRDRVAFIRDHVARSPFTLQPFRPDFVMMHKRMRAKLFAFLESPVRTFQRYRETDTSLEARYARAIAAYRRPDLSMALPLIDGLIAEHPNDPYFHELKGQMLFETGHAKDAVSHYAKAAELLPDHPLMLIQLAQVQIESDDDQNLTAAIKHLNKALRLEPANLTAWRLSAIAHGRNGDEGMTAYAMAEQAMLENRIPDAAFHAGKAERFLPKGGPIWLRLQDIKDQARQNQPDTKGRNR